VVCWQVEAVFAALKGEFEQLFALNHIGVLIQLADACQRLNTKEKAFVKVFTSHVHLLIYCCDCGSLLTHAGSR